MTYSIDMLLAELGQDLPLGNTERNRRTVVRAVRYTLERIGKKLIGLPRVIPVEVVNHYVQEVSLPEAVWEIDDIGLSPSHMQGEKVGLSHYSRNPLAFSVQDDNTLYLPNMESGQLYASVLLLPCDDTMNIVIAESSYNACFQMSQAYIIKTMPRHPLYNQQLSLMNEAKGYADEARAKLNQRGRSADNRKLRRYLGGGGIPQANPYLGPTLYPVPLDRWGGEWPLNNPMLDGGHSPDINH